MRNFDDLREQLLRAGIAPRHVRRYLAELRHHHEDLMAEERAHGVTGPAADAAAMTRLGSNDELAAALLAKPQLRSMTARLPWLVFGIAPLSAVITGFVLLVIVTQQVALDAGFYIPRHGFLSPVPAWFVWTMQATMFALNYLAAPLLGGLLAWTAQRQRMTLIWPLLGMALILCLSVHGSFHMDAQGRIFRGFGTIIPFPGLFGSARFNWPVFVTQGVLLCLPMAWLWRARHRTAAAQ